MPSPQAQVYNVVAVATVNVPTTPGTPNGWFNPGATPQPVVDNLQIQNGQYFLLTNQNSQPQNGIWYADPAGPVPVETVGGTGQTGLNPNSTVVAGPNANGVNGNTIWVYTANWRGSGVPGFVLG